MGISEVHKLGYGQINKCQKGNGEGENNCYPPDTTVAICGLRVFGLADGPKPEQVMDLRATFTGPMEARLEWTVVPGADGYNVRYGIKPDKLYLSWQVLGRNSLVLSTLVAQQPYFVAVDSFNRCGVTPGTVCKIIPSA